MFGIILLSVGTLMHIYVIWRASSVPFVNHLVPRKLLIGIGIVLWGGFLSARVFGHGGTGGLAAAVELFGMTVIICRGTGTWGPPMRLWRASEILLVTLRGKKK
jgi:hypothetical protein